MKSKGAQEHPAERRLTAANEEFAGAVSAVREPVQKFGWDPYEVWATRVKAPARAKRERLRDPSAQS